MLFTAIAALGLTKVPCSTKESLIKRMAQPIFAVNKFPHEAKNHNSKLLEMHVVQTKPLILLETVTAPNGRKVRHLQMFWPSQLTRISGSKATPKLGKLPQKTVTRTYRHSQKKMMVRTSKNVAS